MTINIFLIGNYKWRKNPFFFFFPLCNIFTQRSHVLTDIQACREMPGPVQTHQYLSFRLQITESTHSSSIMEKLTFHLIPTVTSSVRLAGLGWSLRIAAAAARVEKVKSHTLLDKSTFLTSISVVWSLLRLISILRATKLVLAAKQVRGRNLIILILPMSSSCVCVTFFFSSPVIDSSLVFGELNEITAAEMLTAI